MKNLDLLKEEKTKIQQRLMAAMKDGNEANFQQAFADFTELLEQAVMAEAKGLIESKDQQILSSRGVRTLTSEENTYYQQVIDAMKSSNPQQALTDLDVVLPKTIIDSIFDDMTEAHPILNYINFQNTGALVEILLSTTSGTVAWVSLRTQSPQNWRAILLMLILHKRRFPPLCLLQNPCWILVPHGWIAMFAPYFPKRWPPGWKRLSWTATVTQNLSA